MRRSKHMKGHYRHTKQGETLRGFPGSAGGGRGIGHEFQGAQIGGKRASRKHNRKA